MSDNRTLLPDIVAGTTFVLLFDNKRIRKPQHVAISALASLAVGLSYNQFVPDNEVFYRLHAEKVDVSYSTSVITLASLSAWHTNTRGGNHRNLITKYPYLSFFAIGLCPGSVKAIYNGLRKEYSEAIGSCGLKTHRIDPDKRRYLEQEAFLREQERLQESKD